MRVILVSFYERRRWAQYPTAHSLAAMRMGAYLRRVQPELEVSLLAFDLHEPVAEVAAAILALEPDLVGFSAYIWTRARAEVVSGTIAAQRPELTLVVGGPEINSMALDLWPEGCLFVAGPGEHALAWLCARRCRVDAAGLLAEVDASPHAIITQTSDRAAVLARDKAAKKSPRLPEGVPLYGEAAAPMFANMPPGDGFEWFETARGCIYTCSFCGHNTLPFFATFDTAFVEQELRNLAARNVEEIFIIDPILGGKQARGKAILRLLQRHAPQVRVRAYMRPEFLDDEFVDLLAASNLAEVLLGIQTTNPKVPRHVRSNDFRRIATYLPSLTRRGVPWRTELITGLPGDTMAGLRDSLRFVIDELRPSAVYAYPLTAIPETKIHAMLDRTDERFWIRADGRLRVIASNSYSERELIEMLVYAGALTSAYAWAREHARASSFAALDAMVGERLREASREHLAIFQSQDPEAGRRIWAESAARVGSNQS